MIENHDTLQSFLESGKARILSAKIAAAGIEALAIHVQEGQALLCKGAALPIIEGNTCLAAFAEGDPNIYDSDLSRSVDVTGEISDHLLIGGTTNYYHFMMSHLPCLVFLKVQPDPISLAIGAMPKSLETFLPKLLPVFCNGHPVPVSMAPLGAYRVRNVIFPLLPTRLLSVYLSRNVILPLVLKMAGIVDAIKERGPIKIFVKREDHLNGRNLINQAEVEG